MSTFETLAAQVPEALLAEALTHPTYVAENGGRDYQRLEFLGDAVVGLVVAELLVERHPERPEGDLTRAKHKLVSNQVALAALSEALGLPARQRLGKGARKLGEGSTPKGKANVLEAVVGALFLSGGLPACRDWLRPLLEPMVGDPELFATDPKTRLTQVCQKRGWSWKFIQTGREDLLWSVELRAGEGRWTGSDRTVQGAEFRAAEAALRDIEGVSGG